MRVLNDMETCDRCCKGQLGMPLIELDGADIAADCMEDDDEAVVRICRRCLGEIIEFMDNA